MAVNRRRRWTAISVGISATLAAYALWVARDQSMAREKIVTLYASLSVETSPSRLRQLVGATRHLWLNNETNPTFVMTPLAWDAGNWNIRLEYAGDMLCSARIGIYDDGSRPKGAPPDRRFACRR